MLDLGILSLSLLYVLGFFMASQWPMKRSALLRALGVAKNLKSDEDSSAKSRFQLINEINNMAYKNEIAATMADLIRTDGAGSWPPRANHALDAWPAALRPFQEIYIEMATDLANTEASLDDSVNVARILRFREKFRILLEERFDIIQVRGVLKSVENGQWDIISRDAWNAFYCCVAACRHAYRWATIPVVKVAQLETEIDFPPALIETWAALQKHFGCSSEAGNNTSSLILNFDRDGNYVYRINVGLSEKIMSSEEAFSRVFHEIESTALPVYYDMIRAVSAFAHGDKAACAAHMFRITSQLRPLLSSYYDRVHDPVIAHSAWLSHVQGFFAWGAGYHDEAAGKFVMFDGLSGNQVLLFQALDAFLGLEAYLPEETRLRNVPAKQRELARVFEKHSFRAKLDVENDREDALIAKEFDAVVKRLRVFRSAHRSRAKIYLSQPAPERLPMTAGKFLLDSDIEKSLGLLDEFMLGRLAQTI